jgi:hypothetical protein
MDDAVTELAAYFRARTLVPDDELIRLTSAARAGGHSWAAIAARPAHPPARLDRRLGTAGREAAAPPADPAGH